MDKLRASEEGADQACFGPADHAFSCGPPASVIFCPVRKDGKVRPNGIADERERLTEHENESVENGSKVELFARATQ